MSPRLAAALGVLVISFSAIWVRLAAVSPATAAFFRSAYAVLPLLLLVVIGAQSARRVGGRAERRGWRVRSLAVLAGALLGADLVFWHAAIEHIGAGLATVLGNTQVVFVGAVAWLVHRERPSPTALATVPVVFAGVVLISGLGRADAYGQEPALGVLLGLCTALTYTAFLLIFRHANRAQGPVAGPLLDATLGAALAAWIAGQWESGFSLTPSWPEHGWLLVLALGSQVLGWLLISTALPRLAALETSVTLLLQPALTVLWAQILFQERLSPFQWLGAGLVLGGVGWLSIRGAVE